MKISYGKNVYGTSEIKAVLSQLKISTQMGNSVAEFEKGIATKFSKKYGLMVNSGSSAIMLAIKVLNLKPLYLSLYVGFVFQFFSEIHLRCWRLLDLQHQ